MCVCIFERRELLLRFVTNIITMVIINLTLGDQSLQKEVILRIKGTEKLSN